MGRGSSKAGGRGGGAFAGGSVTVTTADGFVQTYTEHEGNVYSLGRDGFEVPQLIAENMSLKTLVERARANGATIEARTAEQDRQRNEAHRIERWNRPDYELGYGLGPGGSISRGARKTARTNRLQTRVARRSTRRR